MPRFLVLALALAFLPAAPIGAETDAELPRRAAALHARILTIDTHLDTPTFCFLSIENGHAIGRDLALKPAGQGHELFARARLRLTANRRA